MKIKLMGSIVTVIAAVLCALIIYKTNYHWASFVLALIVGLTAAFFASFKKVGEVDVGFDDKVIEITYGDGTKEYCELEEDPTGRVLQKVMNSDEPVFANFKTVKRP